jgi:hypothetical protein
LSRLRDGICGRNAAPDLLVRRQQLKIKTMEVEEAA